MTNASAGTRIGAIDIGTNTVLLTIAERGAHRAGEVGVSTRSSRYTVLREEARITRIGRGVAKSGVIESAAAERTLACLAEYAQLLSASGVSALRVVGTSALRDAQNGPEFRARAQELLGADVDIITGAREAELTFRGALTALEGFVPSDAEIFAFDIGGGSTEFTLGSASGQVRAFESLDVGTVRLTETIFPADFPSNRRATPELLAALDASIGRALDSSLVLPALGRSTDSDQGEATAPPLVVGIAGTVTTLLTLVHSRLGSPSSERTEREPPGPHPSHLGPLTPSSLVALEAQLAASTLDERLSWPELDPGRADVILAGSRLTPRIAERAARSMGSATGVNIFVSDRGVRHGLLLELAVALP